MQHNPLLHGDLGRPSATPPAESGWGIPTTPFPSSEGASGYVEPKYREYMSLTVPGGPGYRPAASGTSTVPAKRRPWVLRTGVLAALTLLLMVIFGVGLFAGWQFGRTGTASTTATPTATPTASTAFAVEAAQEAVIAKVKPAVVQVEVTAQNKSGIGSGIIIDQRGYIVTNKHVVSGAQRIGVMLSDETWLSAQLVGTDPTDDLAILQVTTQRPLTVATLGDSSKLQVGQNVLAIGNPLGMTQSVAHGIISALGRNVSAEQGGATMANAIQVDAAVNAGDSGGALIDLQGKVIGIITLQAVNTKYKTPADGMGFAIPSNRVASFVSQLIGT